jgi:hypothetical protein
MATIERVLLPLEQRKVWRTEVIMQHLIRTPGVYDGVVCFTSGNAGRALTDAMARYGFTLEVVVVGPGGGLEPTAWWTAERIARTWPRFFDATPGHLGPHLMRDLAAHIREQLPALPSMYGRRRYEVPTGSGETFVALRMAMPELDAIGIYDDRVPGTTWHPQAPLNALAAALGARRDVVRA